jgi:dolichol-phosphate mannosyltransferase
MAADSSIVFPMIKQGVAPAATAVSHDSTAAAELTIVVPTLNERENILPLLEKIGAALPGVAWEVIFVDDDSRDGTADTVRAVGRRDPRVRCLQRLGRRGLSTACIEGVLASSSPYIAVMDADMQHDERLLPQMLEALKSGACDLAVGSRYIPGGGIGDWASSRANMSGFATRLSQTICRAAIADPMSGFFMVRRDVFERSMRRLSGQGFKILLDLVVSSPQRLSIKELPYHFRARQHGASKLDTLVAWEFAMLLADKLMGSRVPVSLVLAGLIMMFGVLLYAGARWIGAYAYSTSFAESQIVAIMISAAAIFFLNQLFTHRDKRLSGGRLIRRLLLFFIVTGAMGFTVTSWASGAFTAGTASRASITAAALLSTACSYLIAWLLSQPKP